MTEKPEKFRLLVDKERKIWMYKNSPVVYKYFSRFPQNKINIFNNEMN